MFKDDMSQRPCCPRTGTPYHGSVSCRTWERLIILKWASVSLNGLSVKIDPSPFFQSGLKSKSVPESEFDRSPLAGECVG